MSQIVYVLTNAAMPGYAKVGFTTTSVEQRLRELDTTSVPLPFECYYAASVKDARAVERSLHDAFMDHRIRSNREFFHISPDRVVAALKLAEIEDLTPRAPARFTEDQKKDLDDAERRRPPFRFGLIGIAPGAVLTYAKDSAQTAIVLDDRSVEFRGKVTSVGDAAKTLLGVPYSVNGALYWEYEGETLDERRSRIEGDSSGR